MNSKFLRTLRLGISSLIVHKLRSGLAVLGIFIGVTAVIWLVAMGEGVSYQAQQQIKDLGATNIIVRSVKPPQQSSSDRQSAFLEYGLLRDDYRRIVSNIPFIRQAVPMREFRREMRYWGRTVDIHLVGCTPEYLSLNHLEMSRGRFLNRRDIIQQFLTETVVMTGTGGLLGVAVGYCCKPVFWAVRETSQWLLPDLLPETVQTLEPRVALWSVIAALAISVGVGLVFGLYPARRAAFMDPIEALRHE